jgi:hypothetical protein
MDKTERPEQAKERHGSDCAQVVNKVNTAAFIQARRVPLAPIFTPFQ